MKTEQEIHPTCLYLETHQTMGERNVSLLVNDSSVRINKNFHKKSHDFVSSSHKVLLSAVIAGIFVGIAIVGLFVLLSNLATEGETLRVAQVKKEQTGTTNLASQATIFYTLKETTTLYNDKNNKPKYENCLGLSNGKYLTITCPTRYGYVYKALVEIPSNLISQFESRVFSLRNFSISENVDSVQIEYGKNIYIANFILH